jgi:hypothetical protein
MYRVEADALMKHTALARWLQDDYLRVRVDFC